MNRTGFRHRLPGPILHTRSRETRPSGQRIAGAAQRLDLVAQRRRPLELEVRRRRPHLRLQRLQMGVELGLGARPVAGAAWRTRRPPPSVPTSPCPPFGKAKRAVIRLPTSVHDDRICCSTSPHWGVQDPPDCALVRRSGASVRRWSRNRNLRPAIAQLRHLPISRAWPTFPRLDPQRPHLLDAPANLRHGHLVLTCSK